MNKEVSIKIYNDRFKVNFEDDLDYNKYRYNKKKFFVLEILSYTLAFLWLIVLFLMKWNSLKIYFLIIEFIILYFYSKYFFKYRDYYLKYIFEVIINEIKRNGHRITYSNNKTGHITYVKNGVGRSIYVFKGKNAKGAN